MSMNRTSPASLLRRLEAALSAHDGNEMASIIAFISVTFDAKARQKQAADPALITLYGLVGLFLRDTGDTKEARGFLESSIAVQSLLGSAADEIGASVADALKEMLETDLERAGQTGDHKAGRRAASEMLLLLQRTGASPTAHAACLNNLAYFELQGGDISSAERRYAEAVALWRRHDSQALPSDLPSGLNNLARLHLRRGDCSKAFPLFREAVSLLQESCDAGRSDFLSIVAALGSRLRTLDERDPKAAQVVELCERILLLGRVSSEFGLALDAGGGGPEAEGLHAAAVAIFERILGPSHTDTQLAKSRLAASVRA